MCYQPLMFIKTEPKTHFVFVFWNLTKKRFLTCAICHDVPAWSWRRRPGVVRPGFFPICPSFPIVCVRLPLLALDIRSGPAVGALFVCPGLFADVRCLCGAGVTWASSCPQCCQRLSTLWAPFLLPCGWCPAAVVRLSAVAFRHFLVDWDGGVIGVGVGLAVCGSLGFDGSWGSLGGLVAVQFLESGLPLCSALEFLLLELRLPWVRRDRDVAVPFVVVQCEHLRWCCSRAVVSVWAGWLHHKIYCKSMLFAHGCSCLPA